MDTYSWNLESSCKVWNWYPSGFALVGGKVFQSPAGFSHVSNVSWHGALLHSVRTRGSAVLLCCHLQAVTVTGNSRRVSHSEDTQCAHSPLSGIGHVDWRTYRWNWDIVRAWVLGKQYIWSLIYASLHLGMRDVYSVSWAFYSPGFNEDTYICTPPPPHPAQHTHLLIIINIITDEGLCTVVHEL